MYRIAGKFGGGKFGEIALFECLVRKVWRMNRLSHKVTIITTNLDWQIPDDLPNSPNFLPAKLSYYMVPYTKGIFCKYFVSEKIDFHVN